jgi:hypothetical protein
MLVLIYQTIRCILCVSIIRLSHYTKPKVGSRWNINEKVIVVYYRYNPGVCRWDWRKPRMISIRYLMPRLRFEKEKLPKKSQEHYYSSKSSPIHHSFVHSSSYVLTLHSLATDVLVNTQKAINSGCYIHQYLTWCSSSHQAERMIRKVMDRGTLHHGCRFQIRKSILPSDV